MPCCWCAQVILGALEAADVAAAAVMALEMHGTGTPLGEPPAAVDVYACTEDLLLRIIWYSRRQIGPEAQSATLPNPGDPIEVGAATAVLQGGRVPLRLTAAKARIGHAEPAAGSVGIVHVSDSLHRQARTETSLQQPCK